jgi:hypothetical protein
MKNKQCLLEKSGKADRIQNTGFIRKMKNFYSFKILLFFSAAALMLPVPSVLNAADTEKINVLIIYTKDLNPGPDSAEYGNIIKNSIRDRLYNAGFEIIPERAILKYAEDKKLSLNRLEDMDELFSAAGALNADLAVTGFYKSDGKKLIISLKCYDTISGKIVAGIVRTLRISLSLYNYIDAASEDMLKEIRQALSYYKMVANFVQKIEITAADEGMELYLPGNVLFGKIENSTFTAVNTKIAIGTTLRITKIKEGYHSAEEWLYLDKRENTFRLKPLMRITDRALLVYSTPLGQLFGAGASYRYYLKPDTFFAEAGEYIFMQQVFTEGAKPVFHTDTNIRAGMYVYFKPESPFRAAVSSGFGLYNSFFTIPDQPFYTDFYLNAVDILMEYNSQFFTVFFRQEMKYFLGLGENLIGRRWAMQSGPPHMSLGVMLKW